jgi:hypothetical protein
MAMAICAGERPPVHRFAVVEDGSEPPSEPPSEPTPDPDSDPEPEVPSLPDPEPDPGPEPELPLVLESGFEVGKIPSVVVGTMVITVPPVSVELVLESEDIVLSVADVVRASELLIVVACALPAIAVPVEVDWPGTKGSPSDKIVCADVDDVKDAVDSTVVRLPRDACDTPDAVKHGHD